MSTAEILIVGDEILRGEIADENGPWLMRELSDLGAEVRGLSIVGDEPDRIAASVRRCRESGVDYLFVTGGIGPTHDDRTREGVARGLDRSLDTHSRVLEWLEYYYEDDLNDARRRMAELPEDSEAILLEDTPAISFRSDNVYVFPGIPELMKPLFHQWEEPTGEGDFVSETVTIRALEGDIADPLDDLQTQFPDCQIGSYPHPDGTLTLKVRGESLGLVTDAKQAIEEAFEFERVDAADDPTED
jgi:molybdenum cofactor synthesis domain-containing protein